MSRIVLIVLLLGLSAGHALAQQPSPTSIDDRVALEIGRARIANAALATENEILKMRVGDLEKQLAEAQKPPKAEEPK